MRQSPSFMWAPRYWAPEAMFISARTGYTSLSSLPAAFPLCFSHLSPFSTPQEFKHQAIAHCIHAEQSAVASAALAGEPGVTAMAVSAAPCGHCRQFLKELVDGDKLEIVIPDRKPLPLSVLLPDAFGPVDLNVHEPLLAHKSVKLRAISPPQLLFAGQPGRSSPSKAEATAPTSTSKTTTSVTNGHSLNGSDSRASPPPSPPPQAAGVPANAAETKAAIAAQRSYAPFSGAYAGVAILLADGRIIEGIYIENAAFNPALPPLQTALINMAIHHATFEDIVSVVLAERVTDTGVSHRDDTASLLASVAPHARLIYIPMEMRQSRSD